MACTKAEAARTLLGSAHFRELNKGRSQQRTRDKKDTCVVQRETPDTSTRVIMALPKVAIVTGSLKRHDPLPQVEGGGQDALSSV